MNGATVTFASPGTMYGFVATWRLVGSSSGWTNGSRRVYAMNERDAIARCRELVAKDNGWPEGNIEVLEVRPLEGSWPNG